MYLKMNVIANGETEKKVALKPGMEVEYLGHLPGGNVKIRLKDGKEDIAHPLCFKELRD